MENDELIINKKILLERFPGKGGWTFGRLPEIPVQKNNPFGWKKVKGQIDNYKINNYHLMPMGNGNLFLPVKAQIRKKIKKEAGDWVHVILYSDNGPYTTPEDFLLCLRDDSTALNNYNALIDFEKKKLIDWIFSLKSKRLQEERMAIAINKLSKGEKVLL
jgi:hypothetical protein